MPIYRALTPTDDERLIREFILQLKLGQTSADYFQKKFGVDVRKRFAEPLQRIQDWGFGQVEGQTVRLNRRGFCKSTGFRRVFPAAAQKRAIRLIHSSNHGGVMSKSQIEPAPKAFSPRAVYSDLYPLEEFYAAQGLMLPIIDRVQGRDVPAPYHSLLVHPGDMTSTLERFHGDKIHIRVMSSYTCDNEYFREVILELHRARKPVEFGAIKINLDIIPSGAREEILREQEPFGGILAQ